MNHQRVKKEVKTAAENVATQAATDAVIKVAADPNIIRLCPPKVLLNGATYPGITEKCKFML